MSETTLTHKDLAERLGVSETTVKSYRRKFPGCFPVASRGKPIRFTPAAGDVAGRIRELFALGMSVEEVRLRLAQEFPWMGEESAGPATPALRREKAVLAPEITQGVSNMARSMVAIAQQQKTLLARVQGIEAMLAELGLRGAVDAGALRQSANEAVQKRDALMEERLDRLDAACRTLSGSLSSLARDIGYLLARQNSGEAPEEAPGAKVFPLRPETDPSPFPAESPPSQEARTEEPPRSFLALPLVARTAQGQYVSAGGRGRGRFCLNDLKAMLAYGFTPPHHFLLKWEPQGQGWWLSLEQAAPADSPREEPPRLYRLRLMELSTQQGNAVAEILELQKGGDSVHPAELCNIVNSFGV
jgi:DNA-binding transcriptional MerR regulator